MSEPAARSSDRTVVAIAWAVAAVVIALVVAFIAWLALGDREDASGPAGATATQSAVPEGGADGEGATGDEDGTAGEGTESGGATGEADRNATQDGDASSEGGTGAGAADPGATQQSPSPEVEQLLLDLQRRDPDDPMAVGDVDAPVVMIEYADYRCPYCARFHLEIRPELLPLVEDGTLRIEFRDFVIFEETSRLAAVAARAAAEQDRREEFQEAVFALSTEGHGEYGREELVEIAEEVGVADLEQFEADLDDEELLAAVEADSAEARSVGVSSTPTFLINTQVLQGAYPAERMLEIIEQEQQAALQR